MTRVDDLILQLIESGRYTAEAELAAIKVIQAGHRVIQSSLHLVTRKGTFR